MDKASGSDERAAASLSQNPPCDNPAQDEQVTITSSELDANQSNSALPQSHYITSTVTELKSQYTEKHMDMNAMPRSLNNDASFASQKLYETNVSTNDQSDVQTRVNEHDPEELEPRFLDIEPHPFVMSQYLPKKGTHYRLRVDEVSSDADLQADIDDSLDVSPEQHVDDQQECDIDIDDSINERSASFYDMHYVNEQVQQPQSEPDALDMSTSAKPQSESQPECLDTLMDDNISTSQSDQAINAESCKAGETNDNVELEAKSVTCDESDGVECTDESNVTQMDPVELPAQEGISYEDKEVPSSLPVDCDVIVDDGNIVESVVDRVKEGSAIEEVVLTEDIIGEDISEVIIGAVTDGIERDTVLGEEIAEVGVGKEVFPVATEDSHKRDVGENILRDDVTDANVTGPDIGDDVSGESNITVVTQHNDRQGEVGENVSRAEGFVVDDIVTREDVQNVKTTMLEVDNDIQKHESNVVGVGDISDTPDGEIIQKPSSTEMVSEAERDDLPTTIQCDDPHNITVDATPPHDADDHTDGTADAILPDDSENPNDVMPNAVLPHDSKDASHGIADTALPTGSENTAILPYDSKDPNDSTIYAILPHDSKDANDSSTVDAILPNGSENTAILPYDSKDPNDSTTDAILPHDSKDANDSTVDAILSNDSENTAIPPHDSKDSNDDTTYTILTHDGKDPIDDLLDVILPHDSKHPNGGTTDTILLPPYDEDVETTRALKRQLEKSAAELREMCSILATKDSDLRKLALQLELANDIIRTLKSEKSDTGEQHQSVNISDPVELEEMQTPPVKASAEEIKSILYSKRKLIYKKDLLKKSIGDIQASNKAATNYLKETVGDISQKLRETGMGMARQISELCTVRTEQIETCVGQCRDMDDNIRQLLHEADVLAEEGDDDQLLKLHQTATTLDVDGIRANLPPSYVDYSVNFAPVYEAVANLCLTLNDSFAVIYPTTIQPLDMETYKHIYFTDLMDTGAERELHVKSCITKDSQFWLTPPRTAALHQTLSNLSYTIRRAYMSLEDMTSANLSPNVTAGVYCHVYDRELGQWCRAQVDNVKSLTSITVRLLDYGDLSVIDSPFSLLQFAVHVSTLPFQAAVVTLVTDPPDRMKDTATRWHFNDMVENAVVKCTFTAKKEGECTRGVMVAVPQQDGSFVDYNSLVINKKTGPNFACRDIRETMKAEAEALNQSQSTQNTMGNTQNTMSHTQNSISHSSNILSHSQDHRRNFRDIGNQNVDKNKIAKDTSEENKRDDGGHRKDMKKGRKEGNVQRQDSTSTSEIEEGSKHGNTKDKKKPKKSSRERGKKSGSGVDQHVNKTADPRVESSHTTEGRHLNKTHTDYPHDRQNQHVGDLQPIHGTVQKGGSVVDNLYRPEDKQDAVEVGCQPPVHALVELFQNVGKIKVVKKEEPQIVPEKTDVIETSSVQRDEEKLNSHETQLDDVIDQSEMQLVHKDQDSDVGKTEVTTGDDQDKSPGGLLNLNKDTQYTLDETSYTEVGKVDDHQESVTENSSEGKTLANSDLPPISDVGGGQVMKIEKQISGESGVFMVEQVSGENSHNEGRNVVSDKDADGSAEKHDIFPTSVIHETVECSTDRRQYEVDDGSIDTMNTLVSDLVTKAITDASCDIFKANSTDQSTTQAPDILPYTQFDSNNDDKLAETDQTHTTEAFDQCDGLLAENAKRESPVLDIEIPQTVPGPVRNDELVRNIEQILKDNLQIDRNEINECPLNPTQNLHPHNDNHAQNYPHSENDEHTKIEENADGSNNDSNKHDVHESTVSSRSSPEIISSIEYSISLDRGTTDKKTFRKWKSDKIKARDDTQLSRDLRISPDLTEMSHPIRISPDLPQMSRDLRISPDFLDTPPSEVAMFEDTSVMVDDFSCLPRFPTTKGAKFSITVTSPLQPNGEFTAKLYHNAQAKRAFHEYSSQLIPSGPAIHISPLILVMSPYHHLCRARIIRDLVSEVKVLLVDKGVKETINKINLSSLPAHLPSVPYQTKHTDRLLYVSLLDPRFPPSKHVDILDTLNRPADLPAPPTPPKALPPNRPPPGAFKPISQPYRPIWPPSGPQEQTKLAAHIKENYSPATITDQYIIPPLPNPNMPPQSMPPRLPVNIPTVSNAPRPPNAPSPSQPYNTLLPNAQRPTNAPLSNPLPFNSLHADPSLPSNPSTAPPLPIDPPPTLSTSRHNSVWTSYLDSNPPEFNSLAHIPKPQPQQPKYKILARPKNPEDQYNPDAKTDSTTSLSSSASSDGTLGQRQSGVGADNSVTTKAFTQSFTQSLHSNVTCYNCQEKGHMKGQCPRPRDPLLGPMNQFQRRNHSKGGNMSSHKSESALSRQQSNQSGMKRQSSHMHQNRPHQQQQHNSQQQKQHNNPQQQQHNSQQQKQHNNPQQQQQYDGQQQENRRRYQEHFRQMQQQDGLFQQHNRQQDNRSPQQHNRPQDGSYQQNNRQHDNRSPQQHNRQQDGSQQQHNRQQQHGSQQHNRQQQHMGGGRRGGQNQMGNQSNNRDENRGGGRGDRSGNRGHRNNNWGNDKRGNDRGDNHHDRGDNQGGRSTGENWGDDMGHSKGDKQDATRSDNRSPIGEMW